MSRHALSLPLAQGVVVTVEDCGDRMFVFYWGTPEYLLAAGCLSPKMLYPGTKGITRGDEHGDRVYVKRRAKGLWRVMRVKPRALAVHLPGVEMYLREFATAGMTYQTWGGSIEEESRPPPSRPSYLRLVVDNTRPEVTTHG